MVFFRFHNGNVNIIALIADMEDVLNYSENLETQ